jgi:hypothetical protein
MSRGWLPLTRIAQISAAASRTERAFTPVFDGLWLDDAADKLRSGLSPPGTRRGEVKMAAGSARYSISSESFR